MAGEIRIRKAVVPAAGRGARLDRKGTPKPLVEVGGAPLLFRVLAQLAAAGIDEATVIVGWQGREIEREIERARGGARLPLRVRCALAPGWEVGLSASLLAAAPHVAEPFVIAMADHVFDGRLIERLAGAAPADGEVIALVERDVEQVYDLAAAVKVALDGDRVTAIGPLARYDGIDAGLFAATPALFPALGRAVAAGRGALADALTEVARAGGLRAAWTDGLAWDDVDTPAAAIHAEMRLRNARRGGASAATRTAAAQYRFVTGGTATTELIVRRGAATDPDRFELAVPPESGSSPLFVITDETVNGLYGDRFIEALARGGHDVRRIVMPDGEQAKTLENFGRVVEAVLAQGIDERSILISLGGGVVCNVSGFAAATLYRGIGLVHVPTTLMAQCDAAISHKQALNGARGKNLVGAYYAPQQIVVDVAFLQTLTDRQLRDGLAEALKHALAQDPAYLAWFLAQGRELRDPRFLEHVVRRNIELKCELMAGDPKERAAGLVLQYAHNVAHAVEHLSGYQLMHGESVAIGMMVAARVSRILGGCDEELVETHDRLLERYDLPRQVPASMRAADVIAAMRYDKKTLAEGVRMPLLAGVGALWRIDGDYAIPVPEQVLVEALAASGAAA
jgi:3-dehydroquinate synthase